jgi:hypothetical protein
MSPNRIVPLLLCVLVGAFALSACSNPFSSDPPLPDSTFTRVLIDLHLTNARGKHLTQMSPNIRDSVFAYHDVNREGFDATLRYYSRHPSAFESLYDAVIDTLKALQDQSPSRPPESDDGRRTGARPDIP